MEMQWIKEGALGSGASGCVTLWRNQLTNERIAIKTFKDSKNRESYIEEIEIMKKLSHNNLVRVVPIPEPFQKIPYSILCMEYCSEGNLRKVLNKPENCAGLSERTVRSCLKNVKDALEYIHSQNIVHRDLKPENVVLQVVQDQVVFKLIDLGSGKEFNQSTLELTLVGTLDYVAPEVFSGGRFLPASLDYWSFGFICHEIITGYRPFLPHLSPYIWIEKVQFKTDDVICVYERPYRVSGNDNINFSKRLANENHISKILANKMELWLRLALKIDNKKRGRNAADEVVIFRSLDEILNIKVITVFSTFSCEFLSYEVDESTIISLIKQKINKDTDHSIENQVLLLPSGEAVDDEAKVIDFWNPACEGAMLYVFTHEGIPLPLKDTVKMTPTVVKLTEKIKELLHYHQRKRVYSDSIHYIHTQINVFEALYEALTVELFVNFESVIPCKRVKSPFNEIKNKDLLCKKPSPSIALINCQTSIISSRHSKSVNFSDPRLSVLKSFDNITAIGENAKLKLVHCTAKLQMVQNSIQYNEKSYNAACESRVVAGGNDFLEKKKQKMISLKLVMKQLEDELSKYSRQMKDVESHLAESHSLDDKRENLESLKKCLQKSYTIYRNLQQMNKELRESEGDCSEMGNVIFTFFEAVVSFNESFHKIVEKVKNYKSTLSSLRLALQNLCCDIKDLDTSIVNVELGLFKAIWGLKKPEALNRSPMMFRGDIAGHPSTSPFWNQATSLDSEGSACSTLHEDNPAFTASLIGTNQNLFREFEESMVRYHENLEGIKKRYESLDEELQAI